MARFHDAVQFDDAVAHGNMAAIGDVAPFDITYEMHAFYPRQYIYMLCMARQMRRGEARLYCYSPR